MPHYSYREEVPVGRGLRLWEVALQTTRKLDASCGAALEQYSRASHFPSPRSLLFCPIYAGGNNEQRAGSGARGSRKRR